MKIAAIAPFLLATVASAQLAEIVTLGTRPYYLVDEMKPSQLKDILRKWTQLIHVKSKK